MKNEIVGLFYKKEEGISSVCEAICSGIFNDLGGGRNVDICVINKVLIPPNI